MFGASPLVAARTSVHFVSQTAIDDGLADRLRIERRLVATADVRSRGKADMPLNDATPDIRVDADTFTVSVDGEVWDDPATSDDETADNGEYAIWGYGDEKSEWWDVGFPAEIPNCTKCHTGTLADVVYQLVGGLRSGMGYAGTATLESLRNGARFMRVTTAGREESHPHDVTITRESPNYQRG